MIAGVGFGTVHTTLQMGIHSTSTGELNKHTNKMAAIDKPTAGDAAWHFFLGVGEWSEMEIFPSLVMY